MRGIVPALRDVSQPTWHLLVTVYAAISAQLLTDRLNGEGVPTRVRSDSRASGDGATRRRFSPCRRISLGFQRAACCRSSSSRRTSRSILATGRLGTDRTGQERQAGILAFE